jgi:hypothetical protein
VVEPADGEEGTALRTMGAEGADRDPPNELPLPLLVEPTEPLEGALREPPKLEPPEDRLPPKLEPPERLPPKEDPEPREPPNELLPLENEPPRDPPNPPRDPPNPANEKSLVNVKANMASANTNFFMLLILL